MLAERQILGFVELAHAAAGDEANDAEAIAEQVVRMKQRGVLDGRGFGVGAAMALAWDGHGDGSI